MPYAGQLAELPGGQGTLTSDNNAARARFLDLVVAEGIVSGRGVWEREPGATPYTDTPVGDSSVHITYPSSPTGAAAVYASYLLTGDFSYVGLTTHFSGVLGTISAVVGSGGDSGAQEVPSGAAIVVTVTRYNTLLTALDGITDDAGNTYEMIGRSTVLGVGATELWVALNVAPLATGDHILLSLAPSAGANPRIAVGGIHIVNGLRELDEVMTASAGVGSTGFTQPSGFTLAEQSEAVLVAYGDGNNASGVSVSPDQMQTTQVAACAIASQLMYGPLPFNITAANALSDYWTSTSVQRLLALGSDGVAYKSSGGAFTALNMATTMSDEPGAMIVVGGQEEAGRDRKAFFFDGVTKIQTLSGDGSSTTNFGNNWNTTTNIPLDWAVNPPRGAVIHKERLWPWAPANAPHNIYASKLRDHENFKNAVGGTLEYVQEIGTGSGLRIAAGVSFKGMLFVGKFPRGVFFLDDTDVDFLNWRWNLVSDAVGVADSPYAMLGMDDDVLLVDPAGHIHFLSAITQQGVATSDLTAALNLQQWTKDNINLSRLDRMTSTWYPAEKLAILGFSSVGSTENDLRMYLDFSNADAEAGAASVRISYSHRDVTRAMTVRRDSTVDGVQRPVFSEDDGVIWKWTPDSKIKVGRPDAGQARYQYNPTNFSFLDPSLANKRKLFDALTVTFNPVGAWNLAVDTIIDGEYHETLYFNMGGPASLLGTFVFGDRLGGGSITTTRRRMTGNGYWLSIAGWVQGDGHDFSVASHLVNFRVGGEEQR